jgi:hypothetical protein
MRGLTVVSPGTRGSGWSTRLHRSPGKRGAGDHEPVSFVAANVARGVATGETGAFPALSAATWVSDDEAPPHAVRAVIDATRRNDFMVRVFRNIAVRR